MKYRFKLKKGICMSILQMNGEDISSLEKLKQNLDIEKLLEHRHNFHKWLFGEDYEEEALAVKKLNTNLTNEQWLNEVGKICGFASELKKKEVSISKKNVLEKYLQLEIFFDDFKSKIKKLDSNHPSTRELQEKFKAKLSEMIIACENEIDVVENKIEWDKLVIAFFGVTNAGKSTIIDTFRILFDDNRKPNSDGLIVGDGRSDFTKDYNKYNLKINNKPFILIDVPGIEGKEEDYKDCIKDALSQVHCVFYVNGHNKKPDSAIALKIKKYLGDWVEVHSIHNIRGDVSHYDEEEERISLINQDIAKIGLEITSAFKESLGDVYKGNLQVQGLLAMCAKGNFPEERKSLRKSQEKLLRYFGSPEKILEFSHFSSIIDLVNNKTSNFTKEIIRANNQKIFSIAHKAQKEIQLLLNNESKTISEIKNQLSTFRNDAALIFSEAKKNLNSKSKNIIKENINKFKNDAFSQISDNYGFSNYCRSKIEELSLQMQCMLEVEIEELFELEVKRIVASIDRKKKDIDGIKIFYTPSNIEYMIDIDCDFSISTDELDWNWDDTGDVVGSAGGGAAAGAAIGSIVPGVGTLLGALIGGVVGGVGNLASDRKSKKIASAKNLFSQQIKIIEENITDTINNVISRISSSLDKEEKKINSLIVKENENLNDLDSLVFTAKRSLNSFINQL